MNYKELEKELESIIEKLESGEVGLEEASTLYERGARITKTLYEKLKNEKGKITIIKEELGKITEEDFD